MQERIFKLKIETWEKSLSILNDNGDKLSDSELNAIKTLSNQWRQSQFGPNTTSRIERLVKLLKNEEKRHGNDLDLKQASKDFGGASRELYTTDEETFNQFKTYASQNMGGPVLNEEQQRRRTEEKQRKQREAELEQRRREAEERRRLEAEERARLETEERRRLEEAARRRAEELRAREEDAENARRWAAEFDELLGNNNRTSQPEEPIVRTVEEPISSSSGGTHFSFKALGKLIASFGGIALLGLIPFLLLQFGIYLWDDHWFWALVVWFLALCSIGIAFYGWLAWAAILLPLWICTTSWWWLGAIIYIGELIWLYNACQEED